jgi:hypothetical protein
MPGSTQQGRRPVWRFLSVALARRSARVFGAVHLRGTDHPDILAWMLALHDLVREFKQNGSRRLDRVRNPVVEYQYTERKLVVNVRNTAVQGSIQQLLAGKREPLSITG